MTDPLFKSTHSALAFAYNNTGRMPPDSVGKNIEDKDKPPSRGLGGMDGAAQAGMILAEVAKAQSTDGRRDLSKAWIGHVLAARFSPRVLPCACRARCCSGWMRGTEWDEAVRWITEMALGQLEGHVQNYRLRRGIVARNFGEKVNLTDLAHLAKVHPDTVTKHNDILTVWMEELERKAKREVGANLQLAGIVST